jgi:hypothetical protein
LSVPKKYIGQTINCPHNGCIVQVPADAAPTTSRGDSRSGIIALGGNGHHAPSPLGDPAAGAESASAQTSLPPAKTPRSFRSKVARFITSEPRAAAVQVAADGKLPELTLAEGGQRRAADAARETNPLVLISVLCLSFGLSAILLMVDFDTSPAQTNAQARARASLRAFFGNAGGELEPYQQSLRAAQQAWARGDREAERAEYRKVLRWLRAEGRGPFSTLTGTRTRDRELEAHLTTLLAE